MLASEHRTWTPIWVVLILAAALALRLVAAGWWQSRLAGERAFAFGDSGSYWLLAQHCVRGEPYRYGIDQSCAFRTPGYPLLLAAWFCVVGDDPPVVYGRWLGAICGMVAVGLVIRLGWQLFDRTTAWVAGLLATVLPDAVGMSIWILSEAPFMPLMLGQLSCWIASERAETSGRWWCWTVLAGVANGLAVLMRPSWLLFVPFVAALSGLVWFVVTFSRRTAAPMEHRAAVTQRFETGPRETGMSRLDSGQPSVEASAQTAGCARWSSPWAASSRRMVAGGLVMMLMTTLVMLPWWLWTFRQTGTWVVTTLQTGASLYDGWRPGADGGSDMRFVEPMYASFLTQEAREPPPPGAPSPEVRFDRYLHDQAVAWAKANPGEVLRLMGVKLVRMWSPWPNALELQSGLARWTVLAGSVPIFLASLWGIKLTWRRGWSYWLCWLPAVYFTGLHLVFASSIRYRQPAMVCLLALAAATGTTVYRTYRSGATPGWRSGDGEPGELAARKPNP